MILYTKLCFVAQRESVTPARVYIPNLLQRLYATTAIGEKKETHDTDVIKKPKRPLNSYLRFSASIYSDVKEKYPEKQAKDIMKEVAAAWSSADDAVKQTYQKQYESEMQVYRQQLEKYKSLIQQNSSESTTPEKPKRPMNAFMLFKQSRQLQHTASNIPYKEWIQQLGLDWRNLPENEKKVFEQQANQLKASYEQEMEIWRQKVQSIRDGNTSSILVKNDNHKKQQNFSKINSEMSLRVINLQTGYEPSTNNKTKSSKTLRMDSTVDRKGSVSKNGINTESNFSATELTKDCQKKLPNDNTDNEIKQETYYANYSALDCSGSPFKLLSEDDNIQDIQSEKHLPNCWSKHKIKNVKIEHALLVACSLTAATVCMWYLLHL